MLPGGSELSAEASMSWALLSVLWLIIQTQAIDTKPTPELKLHEIVYPKRLHISHKRGTENNQTEGYGEEEMYAPEVQYQIMLNGEELILHLQKAKHLLGPDYTETSYSRRGEKVTRSSQHMKHCYYEGQVLNEKDSLASISTCGGLSGYFIHHNQRYRIKPLKSTDEEEHAVFLYSQEEPDIANYKCGARRVSRNIRASRSLKSSEQKDFLQGRKYLDLFLVLDNAFVSMKSGYTSVLITSELTYKAKYKMYKGNVTQMRSFVFEVLNLLNVIYKTIGIQVTLVGMEIWSEGDKIKVDPNLGSTFTNFLLWHRSNLGKMKTHDHAQLLRSQFAIVVGLGYSMLFCGLTDIKEKTRTSREIYITNFQFQSQIVMGLLCIVHSGIGFRNGRVGMAAASSLCSSSSVSVIEAKRKNNVALVGVISHELGHVLGMKDVPYNTKCPTGSCVMNQYLSSKFPKDFSTISNSHFQRYLLSKKPSCLLQAPSPRNIITKPECGNQLLEVGEDCDCGSPEECTSLCCEPLTCKLKSGPGCGGDGSNLITH